MTDSAGISAQTLQDYSLGRLSAEEHQQVEAWLDAHPERASTLLDMSDETSLEHRDPLVELLRTSTQQKPAEVPRDDTYSTGFEQVRRIGQTWQGEEPAEDLTASEGLSQLRDYRLLKKLGAGGMGAVYQALHTRLEKVVAVKVLPKERTQKPELIARFEREMKAVGRLNHPNIVSAFDAGEVEGTHFLVMEYVEGVDLSHLLKTRGRLSCPDAVELVRQVALGLQHAHQEGLIHRDIKPSNILLSNTGQAKLLDLGLARLQELSAENNRELTGYGQIMGTIDYMAPEQFDVSQSVDIRADIYGLGCTLYCLLAGRPPFYSKEHSSVLQVMKAQAEEKPQPLSAHGVTVPAEVEHILQRMLAKEANDRFQNPAQVAAALAPFSPGHQLVTLATKQDRIHVSADAKGEDAPTDIAQDTEFIKTQAENPEPNPTLIAPTLVAETIVAGEPLIVETQSASRKAKARSNPLWIWGTVAGCALFLMLGVFYLKTGAGELRLAVNEDDVKISIDGEEIKIKSPRDQIKISVPTGKRTLVVEKDGFTAYTTEFQVKRNGKIELSAILKPEQPEKAVQEQQSPAVPTLPKEYQGGSLVRFGSHNDEVLDLVLSPDGNLVFSVGRDGMLKVWDFETRKLLRDLKVQPEEERTVMILPRDDGYYVVSGGKDGIIRFFNPQTLELVAKLEGHTEGITRLAHAPGRNLLASASFDRSIRLWDLKTNQQVHRFGYQRGDTIPKIEWMDDLKKLRAHRMWVRSVRFTPDEKSLISGDNDALILEWDVEKRNIKQHIIGHRAPVLMALVTPDGKYVVSGAADNLIRITDLSTGTVRGLLEGHRAKINSLEFDSSGKRLLSTGSDGTARLWDLETLKELTSTEVYGFEVITGKFTPDGKGALIAGTDNIIHHWTFSKE